jgi:hypothetical protein
MPKHILRKTGRADPSGQQAGFGQSQSLKPVLGQPRSMVEIPVCIPADKPEDSKSTTTSTESQQALLQAFSMQPPLGRELMRRRLYGLKKRDAPSEIISEIQRLPEEAFGLEGRQLFISLAREILKNQSDLLTKLWLVDYVEAPPTIEQFVDEDRFLGQTLRPREDNGGLWPTWRQLLHEDHDLDTQIENAVLTGALGTGKTLVLVVLILYRLCLATMLINPQKFFGINRSSRLGFVLLSITRSTVKDTAWSEALNLMAESCYFVETCGFDPKRNYADCRVEMKRVLPDGRTCGIILTAGSQAQHLVGRNVLAVGLDEGNFRLEAEPDLSAHQLYAAARSRMENRFRQIPGFLPTLAIIASSAADETSFTEKVIREITESGRPHAQKVHRFAIYQIQRPGLILSRGWFKVCYGLANLEPYILAGAYAWDGTPVGNQRHEEAPPGARTELVPESYFESFRRDPRAALQEFSGISISGSHRLFPSTVDLEICVDLSTKEGVTNPLVGKAEWLSISMDDPHGIQNYIDASKFLTYASGQNQPRRHPHSRRYAHVDLALVSKAGLAICHLVPQQSVGAIQPNGQPAPGFRLIVEYDLILQIRPGRHGHISIEKIQNFFLTLRNQWGFQFGLITYDMFQSATSLEVLAAKGFRTDRLSIDRDKTAYTAWRMAAQEHRLRFYRHQQLLQEMTRLVDCGRKFDHVPGAGETKDVADAVVGAHLDAISSDEKQTLATENNQACLWDQPRTAGLP